MCDKEKATEALEKCRVHIDKMEQLLNEMEKEIKQQGSLDQQKKTHDIYIIELEKYLQCWNE